MYSKRNGKYIFLHLIIIRTSQHLVELPVEVAQPLIQSTIDTLDKTWLWVSDVLDVAEGQLQQGKIFDTQVIKTTCRTLAFVEQTVKYNIALLLVHCHKLLVHCHKLLIHCHKLLVHCHKLLVHCHKLLIHCHKLLIHCHKLLIHCHKLLIHCHKLLVHCHKLLIHCHKLLIHCHKLLLSFSVTLLH